MLLLGWSVCGPSCIKSLIAGPSITSSLGHLETPRRKMTRFILLFFFLFIGSSSSDQFQSGCFVTDGRDLGRSLHPLNVGHLIFQSGNVQIYLKLSTSDFDSPPHSFRHCKIFLTVPLFSGQPVFPFTVADTVYHSCTTDHDPEGLEWCDTQKYPFLV